MIRDERRKTKDERYRSQLQESETENCVVQKIVFLILLLAMCAFAAPKAKSAAAYYNDAAYLYFENRLPSAEIACDEGLEKYPNDTKLQNLKARIQEAKDEQQKQNEKNNPDKNKNDQDNENQDKQDNQDQNQDQNKDQQNQNDDQQNQNGESSSSNDNSSSSGDNDQQNNQNGSGESSSSENSSSSGNDGQQDQQEDQQNQGAGEEQEQQPEDPSAMSKAEASQLLKDFDERNGERKPWKPMRGQAYPEKDW